MKTLEERIARLERKRGNSELPPFIPVLIGDGKIVTACMAPATGVACDLGAFYERQQWRSRDTCPDAGTCEHAGRCKAGGESNESAQ
ncbi:MAG: hypothetical protein ACOY5W_07545 [Pseudomonadota bacterium]